MKSRSNHPLNGKWVNVILEPTEDENGEASQFHSYNFVKGNSKNYTGGIKKSQLLQTVTLKKGTVVAQLSPANAIPKMLAPKLEFVDNELEFAKNQGPKSNDKLESREML